MSNVHDEIIRDLAACDPVVHVNDGYCTRAVCKLCGVEFPADYHVTVAPERRLKRHRDTCPWRRAKELTT